MAVVSRVEHGQRITCDVPACCKRRARRGQEDGRFLLLMRWEKEMVTVTVNCPECGGTHSVTVPIPEN